MAKLIESIIRLRRDNDYNYERIKNTFIPANGEVVLVDTAKDGLRAKVGNGINTYAELHFTDEDIRNTVQQGYYENGTFYRDVTKQTPSVGMINKIYIDKPTRKIYYFNGEEYLPIEAHLSAASAEMPGVMKLYNTTGQNTDGTMTQKSITDELNLRTKMDIDADDELLIFSLQEENK